MDSLTYLDTTCASVSAATSGSNFGAQVAGGGGGGGSAGNIWDEGNAQSWWLFAGSRHPVRIEPPNIEAAAAAAGSS